MSVWRWLLQESPTIQLSENEHSSDTLEYDTKEIYNHYKEFFYDVLPELEKHGKVRYFRICCNKEQHLRGNLYVEYRNPREAMKAYRALSGRWYGGKQLNVEFCKIDSRQSAICGLFFKKACPKGSSCNFLHIFRNPGDFYAQIEDDRYKERSERFRNNLYIVSDSHSVVECKRREKSPTYQKWVEKQRLLEEHKAAEEERLNNKENEKWSRAEKEGKKKWEFLSRKLEHAREERARQQALIKAEWEVERKRLKEIEKEKLRKLEKKIAKENFLKQQIDEYVEHGGPLPEQLAGVLETNPHKELCPFFKKTATCRFEDSCSRNHVRPIISPCLLFRNFYSHISLQQSENEHGSDTLEYDTKEIYNHFKEFFYDVLPELEKHGKVRYFRICCNKEQHLRGNVYVEYRNPREAMKAYRALSGRWYGGKQLNVEFCKIDSWQSAICGLFFKKACPKGSSCNFLHIFRNPGDFYAQIEDDRYKKRSERFRNNRNENKIEESSRNWRWSESPEQLTSYNEDDKTTPKNGEYRKKHRDNRSGSRERSRRHSSSSKSSKYRKDSQNNHHRTERERSSSRRSKSYKRDRSAS